MLAYFLSDIDDATGVLESVKHFETEILMSFQDKRFFKRKGRYLFRNILTLEKRLKTKVYVYFLIFS